jgi:hypothetical protein
MNRSSSVTRFDCVFEISKFNFVWKLFELKVQIFTEFSTFILRVAVYFKIEHKSGKKIIKKRSTQVSIIGFPKTIPFLVS